ncbi:MAG: M1 family aminopeptidase [Myxococcota bacterium]
MMLPYPRTFLALAVCSALMVTACAGTPRSEQSSKSLEPRRTERDGWEQLPDAVVPLAYELELEIIPFAPSGEDPKGEATVRGTVTIDLMVEAPTDTIAMHGDGLTISAVTITSKDGAVRTPEAIAVGDHGALDVLVGQQLGQGEYTLSVTYERAIGENPKGLYRVLDAGQWYAYTQFEPLEARGAFPCFDEPRFKTPYTTSITAPEGLLAVTNGPELGRVKGDDGSVTYSFAPTKPLPTYLVAFAVGDFDVVEAPEGAIPNVPLRVITPKGKAKLAAYALEKTPAIMALLSDYFGTPYPYAKLDLVAVPNFSSGAMENVGLVTYREAILLLDPERATPRAKFSLQSITAHELAHMWFGNLVTPPWWDELWLNEAFATWMAARAMNTLEPSFDRDVRAVGNLSYLVGIDSKAQTRAIRQPIASRGDIYNAFDGITYSKGATVLRMTESWLGPEVFRDAIRSYMKDHAHGVATTAELMSALRQASGEDVYAMLSGFLDQPGVPLVDVALDCSAAPRLKLSQSRYLPVSSGALDEGEWRVPLCFGYPKGGGLATQCTLLEGREPVTLALSTATCPAWVLPNVEFESYVLFRFDDAATAALVGASTEQLSVRQQLGLYANLSALLSAKSLAPEAYLAMAKQLVETADDFSLLQRAVGTLSGVGGVARREGREAAFAKMAAELLRPRLDVLGFEPVDGERPQAASLRSTLLRTLGGAGEDPYVIAQAKGVVGAFLRDPDAVPSWRAQWVVPIAARNGDAELFDGFVAAIPKAKTPAARRRALSALGYFTDPELQERAMAMFLTDDVRSSEYWSLIGPMFSREETHARVWAWFTTNYDAIIAKLGPMSAPGMVNMGGGFCDDAGKRKVLEFFDDALVGETSGMARNRSLVLESIDSCAVMRSYMKSASLELLSAYD